MTSERGWPVILVPGGILPAQLAYHALVAELGDVVEARVKDLEMYAGEAVPPPGYSLESEVEGIRRVADDAGFDTFHLVGYSAGGASALAFASRYPDRLRSLALMEPAWAGRTGQTRQEAAIYDRFRAIPGLSPDEIMPAFVRTQLASGVEPPPSAPGPPPPWMPSRLKGIGGFMAAFDAYEPDVEILRAFDRPVYFALGGRGNPDLYPRMAERLGGVFSDFTLQVYEDRHHFDPPHRVEPARVAAALRQLWTRAETNQAETMT
ncbi:MAG TPA: alpha/beta hydrolase [Patescibacteria group bacterium]|nr:alpha/beta hydrolase [Patescibacteria group bacterium]